VLKNLILEVRKEGIMRDLFVDREKSKKSDNSLRKVMKIKEEGYEEK
jgi:hypothetical protein